MSEPTRLTADDLPTLRRIAAYFADRERVMDKPWRGPLLRIPHRYLSRLLWQVIGIWARQAAESIERAGYLASDERVDKHGRVGRL